MRNRENLPNNTNQREHFRSPSLSFAAKVRKKVSNVLSRSKEIISDGLKEAFNWALVFGIFSGTVNLILGNPTYFVPTVLRHIGVGAVGGFGVGSVMNLIGGRRR